MLKKLLRFLWCVGWFLLAIYALTRTNHATWETVLLWCGCIGWGYGMHAAFDELTAP